MAILQAYVWDLLRPNLWAQIFGVEKYVLRLLCDFDWSLTKEIMCVF